MEIHPQKENQDHQNNSNEVKDIWLKGILYHKSAINAGKLVGMCGRDEKLL